MKYKACELPNGMFAVDAGRGQYFTNTLCNTLEEAQEQAMIKSAIWHTTQIDKIEREWNKLTNREGESIREWIF
jgi:hypothetical protein